MTPRDQAPFVIDLAACLRGNEITQEWRPAPRPTNSTIEQAITRTWNALATREGIELFNGDLARLVRAETSLSTLHLAL